MKTTLYTTGKLKEYMRKDTAANVESMRLLVQNTHRKYNMQIAFRYW